MESLTSAAALHARHDQLQQQAQLELTQAVKVSLVALQSKGGYSCRMCVLHKLAMPRRLCLSIIKSRCCAGHACPCIAPRPAHVN